MPASLWYLTVVGRPTSLLKRSASVTVHLKGVSTRERMQSVSTSAGTLRGVHSMETLRPLTLAPMIGVSTPTIFVCPPAVAEMLTMAVPCKVPDASDSGTMPFSSVVPVSFTRQSSIVHVIFPLMVDPLSGLCSKWTVSPAG
jgi:hypothetical protein